MAQVNLPVPFISQWDASANISTDNCGPTCIAMIAQFLGKDLTANEIFQKTGAVINTLITVEQLKNAAVNIGFACDWKTGQPVTNLKNYLDNGTPVIALLHNGDLTSRQDTKDTSGHFVVVVGYRDDGYFVNDPDFWGDLRADGDHHFYTKADFEKAWGECHIDGNPDNALLIIQSGTFVDTITFNKLVRKSTSIDVVGNYLNYPQDQIDIDGFGNTVVAKIKQLQEVAFTTPNVPEPVKTVSTPAPVVSETVQTPITSPVQAKPSLKTVILSFLKELINLKEVNN